MTFEVRNKGSIEVVDLTEDRDGPGLIYRRLTLVLTHLYIVSLKPYNTYDKYKPKVTI